MNVDLIFLLLLVGPAGAVGVYWGFYRHYRNTHKSHDFENETAVDAQPVKAHDRKVDTISGTQDPRIDGANGERHRVRVKRLA